VSDTVEFGGWRPPPPWIWLIAGVATLALLAGVITAHTRPRNAASARPKSPSPAATPLHGLRATAVGALARWPAAEGACGSPAYLPRIRLVPYSSDAHPTVLVGGVALRQVTLGRAGSRTLPGLRNQGLVVTKLIAGPGADYAFVDPRCSGYLWVYRIVAGVASLLDTPADDLLGGPQHAWAVTYAPRTVLTPLNGGRKVALKPRTNPVADTADGLVVAYRPRDGGPDTVKLLDPDTGALRRRLATGLPIGAGGHVVLVARPGCGAPPTHSTCTLEGIDLKTGRATARFELPAGRAPVSDAVFSPDGTAAAFQLARARQDLRSTTRRPARPADVAVLHLPKAGHHLQKGGFDIVPGLELPPGTGAGLAWDATGSLLLATVNEGNRGALLAWRQGMPGPALVAELPGPLMVAPPLLPEPPTRPNS
jgi:hypothetical protein